MDDEIIQKLEELKETVKSMQNVKGKQAVIIKINGSITFLQLHKVDRCTMDLIVSAREKDVEEINQKEYKQKEIDWRMPKHLRD